MMEPRGWAYFSPGLTRLLLPQNSRLLPQNSRLLHPRLPLDPRPSVSAEYVNYKQQVHVKSETRGFASKETTSQDKASREKVSPRAKERVPEEGGGATSRAEQVGE